MNSIKLATAAVLASLAFGGTAYANPASADGGHDKRTHRAHGPSLERMAFGNAMVAELATRTGRPAEEIRTLFKDGGPRKAAETLGLEREQMKEAMRSARLTVIAQAQAAQMITAEQAQTLSEAKSWRFGGKKGPRPDKSADPAS
jgi:hypothetical protein